MKVLAIEKDCPGPSPHDMTALLVAEAQAVWELYQGGMIREVYFRDTHPQAILILETETARQAEEILAQLPLVKAGSTSFEVIGLRPYPGFSRLFAS